MNRASEHRVNVSVRVKGRRAARRTQSVIKKTLQFVKQIGTSTQHLFHLQQALVKRAVQQNKKIMLTRNHRALAIRLLMLVALSATLLSFSNAPGADSFKVYLNDKLLFQQYVTRDNAVPTINLGENPGSDLLTVYYDHCGRIGTQRTLTLLDGQQVLKKWEYQDTEVVAASGMNCRVSDLKALQKSGKSPSLVYTAKELQTPLTLLTISSTGMTVTAGK